MTFYEINDITLRKKKIARFLGQESTRKHKDRAYTIEEIRKILEHADIRSKALVLLLVSSGIRIGAVTNLQIKHLKKIEEYNLYRITVYENTKDEYYTFCTPECAAVIDSYLSYRQQSGEKIEADAPLIRERFDILEGLKECSAKRKPEFVQTRGMGEIISNLLLKSGITKTTSYIELEKTGTKYRGSERKSIKRAHGMRKFNLTSLVSADVNPIVKEMLIGHKSSLGLDNNYYKPTEQQVLQEYLKAVDLLTIYDENRLKKKVAVLEKNRDEIEILKLEQKHKDKEMENQMLHYEMRIDQLEQERLEEKQSDLEMLKMAQKQHEQEQQHENQIMHYDMRMIHLEEEKQEQEAQIRQQEIQIQQMSQMLQSIMTELKEVKQQHHHQPQPPPREYCNNKSNHLAAAD
jgi:integrase